MSAIRVFLMYMSIVNFAGTLVRYLVEVRYSECPLRESLLYIIVTISEHAVSLVVVCWGGNI